MTSHFFICGATGTQGGAISHHLINHNHIVHAITRDITSPAARNLQSLDVKLFSGNFDDEKTLREAISGCKGIFLNFMPDVSNASLDLTYAKRLLSIAKEFGVEHVVYSSGFAVNEPQKLTHWDPNSIIGKVLLGKQAIENEVRNLGFKYWTILRPGNFMSNFLQPLARTYHSDLISKGRWITAWTPETQLAMVDPNDIGRFGAAAFLDPGRFHGKEIALASELRGPDELMGALSAATGRDLKAVYLSREDVEVQALTNPMIAGQLAMRDMARFVDMEEVRKWGYPLGTFEQFLEREKERVWQTYHQGV